MITNDINIISSHDLREKLKTLPKEKRFPLGIKAIDYLTRGFGQGELIIITGYSGHGKTTLAQNFTTNISRNKMNCLWFSFELTSQQFLRKFNEPLPLFYIPEKNVATGHKYIEEAIDLALREHPVHAVFIDHLHYIVEMMPGSGLNQSSIIGAACRSLKRYAVDKGITIFLIAHTTQPRGDDPPNLGSIRDSSFIAQESDAVYCINRIRKKGYSSEEYGTDSWFTILKQRETGNIGKKVKLTFENNIYHEAITSDDERKIQV